MILNTINSIISYLKRYKERIIPKYQQTEQEKILTSFIEALLLDNNTLVQPISIFDSYFIINDKKSIIIKISLNDIVIINNTQIYSYNGCLEYKEFLTSKLDSFIYVLNDKFKTRFESEEIKSLNRFISSL